MKSVSLIAIGLAATVLLSAQANLKAATEGGRSSMEAGRLQDAKQYENPDGSKAKPYIRRFAATVKGGVFHGVIGIQGKPGWYDLNGQIGVEGTADLRADEITAFSKYNFTQSKKAPAGRASRYSYQVAAQFDSRRGTGHSTDGWPRIFTFVKE